MSAYNATSFLGVKQNNKTSMSQLKEKAQAVKFGDQRKSFQWYILGTR